MYIIPALDMDGEKPVIPMKRKVKIQHNSAVYFLFTLKNRKTPKEKFKIMDRWRPDTANKWEMPISRKSDFIVLLSLDFSPSNMPVAKEA